MKLKIRIQRKKVVRDNFDEKKKYEIKNEDKKREKSCML